MHETTHTVMSTCSSASDCKGRWKAISHPHNYSSCWVVQVDSLNTVCSSQLLHGKVILYSILVVTRPQYSKEYNYYKQYRLCSPVAGMYPVLHAVYTFHLPYGVHLPDLLQWQYSSACRHCQRRRSSPVCGRALKVRYMTCDKVAFRAMGSLG